MLRKVVVGAAASLAITLLPSLGNPSALLAPQLWLLLAAGLLANVFQPPYNPFDQSAPAADRGTASQIVWSVYLTQALAVVEAVYVRYPQSLQWDLVASMGFLGVLAGLALRTWAVLTLGRHFTWHLETQPGQRVIRRGPYRYARHPSYVGAFCSYVCCPVFLHAWCAAVVASAASTAAFARRIR